MKLLKYAVVVLFFVLFSGITLAEVETWTEIEAWSGAVEAPDRWHLIEMWIKNINARAEWGSIESWTNIVQAPASWKILEIRSGTINAPVAWGLIESRIGTISAPAEWSLIGKWVGKITASRAKPDIGWSPIVGVTVVTIIIVALGAIFIKIKRVSETRRWDVRTTIKFVAILPISILNLVMRRVKPKALGYAIYFSVIVLYFFPVFIKPSLLTVVIPIWITIGAVILLIKMKRGKKQEVEEVKEVEEMPGYEDL